MTRYEVVVGPNGVEVIDGTTGRREVIRGGNSIGASKARAVVPELQEAPSLKFTSMLAS